MMDKEHLRNLPSVDYLLNQPTLQELKQAHSHNLVVDATRDELMAIRTQLLGGQIGLPDLNTILERIVQHVTHILEPSLQPVINATGVIVHTNLGRALLSRRAQQAMVVAAQNYNNLEYDLHQGMRGSRYHHANTLLCRLTGAEAAVVVNNNAAALVLCLSALAQGKEVLISRSQLIEIGGGFRIPDIMTQSGAKLVEVGATNRTYTRDYEEKLDIATTGLILRVHQSNFKLIGFTTEPTLTELVSLSNRYNLPVMDDLGSGTLLDTSPYGLTHEPTIQESIAAGVSVVTASGDKLLGGPQAGLILGRARIINQLKKHPLIRAFRVDKITLAALQATLLAYLENRAIEEIPVWQMIATDIKSLEKRAKSWHQTLTDWGQPSQIVKTFSTVGGGSLPGQQLPTYAIALETEAPDNLAAQLRTQSPPIISRIDNEGLLLDPRTVLTHQDDVLLKTIQQICGPKRSKS